MSTIASFKIPKVTNEPNVCGTSSWVRLKAKLTSKQHHYAKGSAQRKQLTAALESFQKKIPLEVPIVVGGKEVSLASNHELFILLISA